MQTELTDPTYRCPVCLSPDTSDPGFRSVQAIGTYVLRQCNECEHRFLPMPPDDVTLERFYSNTVYGCDPRRVERLGPAWRDRPLARRIRSRLPENARVLEIGSGFGETLLALPRRYTLEGVELSAAAFQATADHPRLSVRQGFFETLDFSDNSYDCIIALAVIEHIRNPAAFLAKIARLLRPGGMLVLMTGDYGSWYARKLGPGWHLYHAAGHLHFFNSRSLGFALNGAGFSPVDTIWAGPTPLSSRLPDPLDRLLHCQTTSLALPWLQARRGYGDLIYVWSALDKHFGTEATR